MSCKIISGSGALCVSNMIQVLGSIHSPGNGVDREMMTFLFHSKDIVPRLFFPSCLFQIRCDPTYQISTAKMTIIPVAPYSLATSFILIYSVSTEDFPFWWVICTDKFHKEHTIAVYKCRSMTGARPPNIFHLAQQSLLGRLDVFLGLTKKEAADEQNPTGAGPWKSLKITVHNDNV